MYRYACEVDYYGVVRLRPHPTINEGAYQRGGLLCCFQQSISAPLRARLYAPPFPQKNESDLEKGRLCHIVPNHRTFIEDYLKILDFIEWLKEYYPEKASFLTKKS